MGWLLPLPVGPTCSAAPRPAHAGFRPGVERLLRRAEDGVFVLGARGAILFWNRAATRILGYTVAEASRRTCCDIFGRHEGAGTRRCFRACAARALPDRGEDIETFEMPAETKAGRRVWLSMTMVASRTHHAEHRAAVYVFRDVTATKELLTRVVESVMPQKFAPSVAAPTGATLTRREIEILRLLTDGLNTRRIAGRLHVSRATVRNHVQHIFGKLDVHSRLEAVAYATRERLF